MPPSEKNPDKKIRSVASDLAVNAMVSRMYDDHKPEDIADFCLAVAKRIIEKDLSSD